ncbi:FAD:protein FMN transferase [Anaerotignum sp.]|uniref:FAD:protein FMN transferase n=1 Tax=Anaerotignum sp. TaxID=2039241 RepID=UPI0028B0770D|nr:FAD:protein FMN transferase [Anaerotignum sp.]
MEKRKSTFLLIILMTLLVGCGVREDKLAEKSESFQSTTIFAMDTIMDIKIYGGESGLLTHIEEKIRDLDNKLSTTDKDSDIYALNLNGKGVVSKDAEVLLEKALSLCRKTQGTLDISIYPIVREWGFTTGEYRVPNEEKIQSLLTTVDYRRIQQEGSNVNLQKGMEVDLGSVAKGYTADEVVFLLEEAGITSALLNLGGNVHALGTKPDGNDWCIAIQDPKGDNPLGVVSVSNEAVVTSGGYERYFEDNKGNLYWHIMDPKTGHPANNGLISVTIISPSGLYADALSTSMFIKGLDKAIDFWKANKDFEAIFVVDDGQVYITEGLEERFSLIESYEDETFQVIRSE